MYSYPVYTNAQYGSTAYLTYAPMPETRDQFIRRYVMERTHDACFYDIGYILQAKTLWDASINIEVK